MNHRTQTYLLCFFFEQDALLASRILITLLKQDDIPHTLIPISGYAELEERKVELFGTEDEPKEGIDVSSCILFPFNIIASVKSDWSAYMTTWIIQITTLILLSLGSLLPLSTYFPLPSSLHIHLLDSHRPYNLTNLFGPAVNDGLGADERIYWKRKEKVDFESIRRGGEEETELELERNGRIWVWGDGAEYGKGMQSLEKSWEALEVSWFCFGQSLFYPRLLKGKERILRMSWLRTRWYRFLV